MRRSLVLGMLAAIMLTPAAARSADLFCPALADDKTYDGAYDSYRKLVAGRDGWIFRSENDLRTDFNLRDRTITAIRRLQDAFASKNIDFIMAYAPTRGMMHADHVLDPSYDAAAAWDGYLKSVAALKQAGVNIASIQSPGIKDFFYKRDHHWTAIGAAAMADVIAADIKARPLYAAIEKIPFKTTQGPARDFTGASSKMFKAVCNSDQPVETIATFITTRENAASGQDELFGTAPSPEIVLLGTSNSVDQSSFANFEGALKTALSADILNMAVTGGGIDTAMLSYLNSDHYRDGLARVVIWEVPAYYDLNKHMGLFRQSVAALQGACVSPLAHADGIALDDHGRTTLLNGLGAHQASGGDYYIRLKFSNADQRRFTVNFEYEGDVDANKISRSNRYDGENIFYLSLKDHKRKPLQAVSVDGARGGVVDIQLCKIKE